jgi:hypothetical protein
MPPITRGGPGTSTPVPPAHNLRNSRPGEPKHPYLHRAAAPYLPIGARASTRDRAIWRASGLAR